MRTGDIVIGGIGMATILFAAVGLVITEARSGPYELDVNLTHVPIETTGTYQARGATGTTGPAGVCVPDAPGGTCTPARLDMDLHITGLPPVAGATYHVFLGGPGDVEPRPLGALEPRDDAHHLEHHSETDASPYEFLLVTLEKDMQPDTPGPLVVYTGGVAVNGPVDLADQHNVRLVTGGGIAYVAQIGAVEVSATAAATIDNIQIPDGWVLRSWFLLHDGTHVALETFELQDGVATMGARVERVDVADVARFLVTLDAAADAGEAPNGFPAFVAVAP